MVNSNIWSLELSTKPDFKESMERIYAWYDGEILDRPPVRFSSHNAEYDIIDNDDFRWKSQRDKWFDTEYQVNKFMQMAERTEFLGETFPIYWPNLGPNVYAAFYGAFIEFGEITSWNQELIRDYKDISKLKFNKDNVYFKKLDEITRYALQQCHGKFMVGYTDLHPGMDCVDSWRGTQNLCFDMYDNKEKVRELCDIAIRDFREIYNYFDALLKKHQQLSCTWMGIPSFGKMHIPSCDFSSMISTENFKEFCLPILNEEVKGMTHNIFHLDGKDVARHIDIILEVDEINAIQWVQGVGEDKPIMQWVPFIKKIQSHNKGVVVDLNLNELEAFMNVVDPKGIFLCIDSSDTAEQKRVLKRLEKWK